MRKAEQCPHQLVGKCFYYTIPSILHFSGSAVITWYRGSRILSAGNLKILDEPRLQVLPDPRGRGVDVRLRRVRMQDEGRYTCQVNLKDTVVNITHQLEVMGE